MNADTSSWGAWLERSTMTKIESDQKREKGDGGITLGFGQDGKMKQ